jgi:dTDP-4-dehydrorhamnose reductase
MGDQKGYPHWTGYLSYALTRVAGAIFVNKNRVPWGTYHFCAKANTTLYDFAVCIIDEAKKSESNHLVIGIYGTKTRKPKILLSQLWIFELDINWGGRADENGWPFNPMGHATRSH